MANDGDVLYEKNWASDIGNFKMVIDQDFFGVTRFYGKGSMEGTRAFISALDEGHKTLGTANLVRAIVDLRELNGVPLRAQFILGKWLLQNKHLFHRIAVFGGNTWEMTFSRAVAKISRFKNIGFYDNEEASAEYVRG